MKVAARVGGIVALGDEANRVSGEMLQRLKRAVARKSPKTGALDRTKSKRLSRDPRGEAVLHVKCVARPKS